MIKVTLPAMMLAAALIGPLCVASDQAGRPRMYFGDAVSGRPYSKDPAVVKFKGRYWLYYSLPPHEGKPTNPVFRPTGDWNCGRATDGALVQDADRPTPACSDRRYPAGRVFPR